MRIAAMKKFRKWVGILWHEYQGLVSAAGLAVPGASAWWFWQSIATFGYWLLAHSEEIRNLALAAGVGAAIFGGCVAYRRSQTDRIR